MLTIKDPETPLVPRPWGGYVVLCSTPSVWVKKLFIHGGERTSLQRHRERSEAWYVLSGRIEVVVGNRAWHCVPGDAVLVPQGRLHRITGLSDACVLEVAYGRVRESDIVRDDDDYGRADELPGKK
ncbi:MAG TPA: phosphomannose isomerase type II C-terminal cupin domain [Burkholderiaceae bacterium]